MRHSEHDPYTFGFEMVLLMASWDHFSIPLTLAPIDPQCRGHQNLLFRQMAKAVVPPTWARQVVVVADTGFAANETLWLIAAKNYAYVLAKPRTRKFTNGDHLRDTVQHLPKRYYYRRASDIPDGRRKDNWMFARRATLHHLGDVTIRTVEETASRWAEGSQDHRDQSDRGKCVQSRTLCSSR